MAKRRAIGNAALDAAKGARFAAALIEVERELNWKLLAADYGATPDENYFGAEQVEAQREAGLLFAADLCALLAPKGSSLYVGAGVAELAMVLSEALVLERRLHVVNLPGPEVSEINRALTAVEARGHGTLPRWFSGNVPESGATDCDHLWMVSVLSDPHSFPALHRMAYKQGKTHTKDLARERARALELVLPALAGLQSEATLHISDVELPLWQSICSERQIVLETSGYGRASAVVGDTVCRLLLRKPDLRREGPAPYRRPGA